jgi:ubiquinone/menaquinone biosynthesis C-methylase UbiE
MTQASQKTPMTQASADDWDQHWQQIGASAERGPASKYRRRTILRVLGIKNQGESVRLLDIGSGTGEFAEEFSRRYPRAQYLGLELSRTGVEVSSRRVPTATFVQCDLLQHSNSDKVPDFSATHAVCSEVLEHVDEPVALLRNASRYLAPGCRLIVTVPGGPMNAFDKHIGHRRHFTPAAIGEVLQQAGFRVERLYGVGFPFFTVYRLFLAWRGQKLINDLSGTPSVTVRFGMGLFDVLFRLNMMRWGWQTVAVARYPGDDGPRPSGT